MRHAEFAIGLEFWCNERRWRCTDVGTRVIVAIRIDRVHIGATDYRSSLLVEGDVAELSGWFKGPPYAVLESVFDEDTMPFCSIHKETD